MDNWRRCFVMYSKWLVPWIQLEMFSRHELRLIVHCVFLHQSQDREWGGQLELKALADVLQRPITVVVPEPTAPHVHMPRPSIRVPWAASWLQLQQPREQRVILSYHRSQTVAGHYKCLSMPSDEDSDQEMKSVDEVD